VLIEEEGLAYRGTFVINPEGRIKIIEVHDNGIWPRREGIAAQGAGGAVRLPSHPGRSVSCEMDSRRQNAVSLARSGREDLIATLGASCSKTISKLN